MSWRDDAGAAHDLVVRVSLGDGAEERAHAAREAHVLLAVGGVAAPVLHDFRLTSPWFAAPVMCLEFIPGRQRDLASAPRADLERLGSLVGSVHHLPVSDDAGGLLTYAAGRVEAILAVLGWARDPLPVPVQAGLREAAERVGASLVGIREAPGFDGPQRLCLLHGDIGPGNLLWAPEPVLIDWEYARAGDPADEIAYTFDQNDLSAAQREAFWRGYSQGRGDLSPVVDRVRWWEPVTLLGSALWWADRYVRRVAALRTGQVDPAISREPDYYLEHVVRRVDRLATSLG